MRSASEEDAKEHEDWTARVGPRAERDRTSGEGDEQEGPVMFRLRDDVHRGLDDGWSRGSRTGSVGTALVCSTLE